MAVTNHKSIMNIRYMMHSQLKLVVLMYRGLITIRLQLQLLILHMHICLLQVQEQVHQLKDFREEQVS